MKDTDVECGGQWKEIHLGGGGANVSLEGGVLENGVIDSREHALRDSDLGQDGGVQMEDGILATHWMENASNCVNHSAISEVQLEGLSRGSTAVIDGCQGNLICNERKRGRKRKKLSNNLTLGTEAVLRYWPRSVMASRSNSPPPMWLLSVASGSFWK